MLEVYHTFVDAVYPTTADLSFVELQNQSDDLTKKCIASISCKGTKSIKIK